MDELREKIARRLCADAGQGGFCDCVGESLGCKVGRGEGFDGSNCLASEAQLILTGYATTAERIMHLIDNR